MSTIGTATNPRSLDRIQRNNGFVRGEYVNSCSHLRSLKNFVFVSALAFGVTVGSPTTSADEQVSAQRNQAATATTPETAKPQSKDAHRFPWTCLTGPPPHTRP